MKMITESTSKKVTLEDLWRLHEELKDQIAARLSEFKEMSVSGSEEDIFAELVFCILTPQSKAKSCDGAVRCLIDDDILMSGNDVQIAQVLKGKVRFHNNKARCIVEARRRFTTKGEIAIRDIAFGFENPMGAREWLVKNIKGLGYKEAGHFLRNIGMGEDLAILDRHILKNLVVFGVIEEVPGSQSPKRYLEIEDKMKKFAENVKIPTSHLDLLLWYKETGEIFK